MKIKDIKALYEKESEQPDIVMSARLKNTPIKTASDDYFAEESESAGDTLALKTKGLNKKALLPVILAAFLLIGIMLAIFNPWGGSKLTAYILEINPTICITANAEEEIVGVYSLNQDADTVLSDEELSGIVGKSLQNGVESIIKVVIGKGFLDDYNKPFGIYAINDDRNKETEKLKNFSAMVEKNLYDNGKGDIKFEQREMSLEDFKHSMNMEGDFRRLDDMWGEMQKRDRFFGEPPKEPLPPPQQNQ